MASLLNDPTLVLNKGWTVVGIATVREALSMISRGRAKAVCPESFLTYDFASWIMEGSIDNGTVRTPTLHVPVPEIVTLQEFNKPIRLKIPFTRANLYKRDTYQCQYCGRRPGKGKLTIDHVVPKSLGGVSSWENCVLACRQCNSRKANKTCARAGMKPRKRPAIPSWDRSLPFLIPRKIRNSWKYFIESKQWDMLVDSHCQEGSWVAEATA